MATAVGGFIATQQIASAAPATINVTMFSHEDSHPDAGDGCSLYEASIAANTQAAYGGCDAGSVDGNVIVLAEGTYVYEGEDSDPLDIELYNTSLNGLGAGVTVIDGYGFSMTGTEPAGIDAVSIASTETNTPIIISNSNKTISNSTISSAHSAAAIILDGTVAEISNLAFTNVYTQAVSGVSVSCSGDCSYISFDNFEIDNATYGSSANINLANSPNVELLNSKLSSYSYNLTSVGENSNIENLTSYIPGCGGNMVSLGEGTAVDGLDHTSGSGCGMGIDGSADSLRNIRQSMPGTVSNFVSFRELSGYEATANTVSWSNSYVGSEVSNVDIVTDGSGINLTLSPKTVSNVSLKSSNSGGMPTLLALGGDYDGTEIDDLVMYNETQGSFLNIHNNNTTINGLEIDGAFDNNSGLYLYGSGITATDIKLTHAIFYSTGGGGMRGDILIDGFTIGSSEPRYHGSVIRTSFDTEDVVIKNGTISNSESGISVTEGTSVLVENVQMENLKTENSPGGAIYTMDVDEVVIKDVTLDNVIYSTMHGAISVYGGSVHSITNTTITDSTGGIALYQSGSPAMVTNINNTTIVNNANTVDHQEADYTFALHAAMMDDSGVVNVTNSVIGGSSPYIECSDNTMPNTQLFLVNTVATHSSCESFGATIIPSLAGVFADSLADNGSSNVPLGYNGEFGGLQTLALLPGENAVLLAGDSSTCEATDARGIDRPDGLCDLGAFQLSSFIQDGGQGQDGNGDNGGSTQGPGAPNTGLNNVGQFGLVIAVLGLLSAAVAAVTLRRL